jgi:hypothetical protein
MIQNVTHHYSGQDFGQPSLFVTFQVDVKAWTRLRDRGQLGTLYGVDLGNMLYRAGILTEYSVPIVSDRDRASKGLKTIRVEYRLKGHPYR